MSMFSELHDWKFMENIIDSELEMTRSNVSETPYSWLIPD